MSVTRRTALRLLGGLLLAPDALLVEPRRKLWPGHDFVSGIRLKKIVGDLEVTPEVHSRLSDSDFQAALARLFAEYVREQAAAERRLLESFRVTPFASIEGGHRFVHAGDLFDLPR